VRYSGANEIKGNAENDTMDNSGDEKMDENFVNHNWFSLCLFCLITQERLDEHI
jgi:hypothetical protein